jgi:two-component system OmpR family sensor kinase
MGVERSVLGRPGDHDHGPGPHFGGGGDAGGVPGTQPGDFVQVRTPAGAILFTRQTPRFDKPTPSPPSLPDSLSAPAGGGPDAARYFSASSLDGKEHYRVRVARGHDSADTIVLATSLRDVDSTLRQLLLIELLVTAVVLAVLVAVGLWVVRIGLRPLDAIGATAAAIAGGDLSRRVEHAEERTEVGRLGLALNAMLTQIETAFNERAASERKLRRFVADASHELRTPLAAVRAYAELFERGAAERPVDLARAMGGISRESERMSLLVDDLLLLARLDEGRPLERKPVALDEVVAEAVETAHAVDPERPIELDVAPTTVTGDRDRLRQIVDNLLANVRAHTPPRASVHVSLARRNGSAEIAVADSGPGMSDDQVAHVFERFYRADASRARASGGVGLGLAIVAAVAEAHGGSVSASADPGHGSTFRIELPLAGSTS